LKLDLEWLAITKTLAPLQSFNYRQKPEPPDANLQKELEKNLVWVKEKFKDPELLIPPFFCKTAAAHGEPGSTEAASYRNPQTLEFCDRLEIECKINPNGIVIPGNESETLEAAKARLLKMVQEI
jgi:hypothetical protein